jgi:phosphopantothenoylcysteine synthetase/decarboxylase
MNVLVTAGNTLVPIDKVRGITNIFTGATGARIALCGLARGHRVTLLTSHPEVVERLWAGEPPSAGRWDVRRYQTFDDLKTAMGSLIRDRALDVVIHSAAVSDYQPAGIYAADRLTHFDLEQAQWQCTGAGPPALVDMRSAKVKSDAAELWLRLVCTPKLVDLVRSDWGFQGILVKFKLEVDVNEGQLLETAERSRRQSNADLMVANTLEGKSGWAYLGPVAGSYDRLSRREMPDRLFAAIEKLAGRKTHG